MKLYATIQLGTFAEDSSVLELLSFPEYVFDDPDPGCRIEVWASGKRHVHRRKQRAEAVTLLEKNRFNEATLTYGEQVWRDRLTRIELRKSIKISPSHPLWLPPFLYGPGSLSREGRDAQASHRSFHSFVRWNDIRRYPTMVLVELGIEKNWDYWEEGEVFSDLVELLWQGLGDRVAEFCAFGALSIDPAGSLITENLSPWPQSIPLLDSLFGDLHPVLLGGESTCLRLRDALTPHLKREPELRRKGALTMLVLGQDLEGLAEHEGVKRCLVPRQGQPGENQRSAQETLGEYALGEKGRIHLYVEKARFVELFGAEALTFHDDDVVFWETIDRQVCAEAGVTPASVIVAYSISREVVEARRRIRIRFDNLSSDLAPDKRVWRAHDDVYREMRDVLFGSEKSKVIDLVRRHFFHRSRGQSQNPDANSFR